MTGQKKRMQRGRVAVLVSALLVVGLLPAAGASADASGAVQQAGNSTFTELDECFLDLPGLPTPGDDLRCGFVDVPLHHDDPGGERVQIATAVIAADDPVDDPVLVLGGGPGQKAIETMVPLFLLVPELLGGAADDRDIVVIDQRGVGFSQPALECPEVEALDPFDPTLDTAELLAAAELHAAEEGNPFLDAYQACRDRLTAVGGVDLTAFHTAANVDDLDAVRAALGHEQMHLYGVSYGARLALQAAGTYPESWASQILDSPVPGEANWFEDIAANYQDTLDRLYAGCAADPACAAAFPDLPAALDTVIERVRDEPAVVDYTDPLSGAPATATIDERFIGNIIFQAFYLPVADLPAVIDALAAERYEVLFELPLTERFDAQHLQEEPEVISASSLGMMQSFICAEELAFADPAVLAGDAATASPVVQAFVDAPFYGAVGFDVCEVWDVPAADASVFDPVETDVPALVVTGGYDQITPPRYGEAVLAGLERATLVEVPDATHGPLLQAEACGAEIFAAFVADPTAELDTSCAAERVVQWLTELPERPDPTVDRVGGADRFETAAEISARAFPDGAPVAYVASGREFPDGLTGGAAAGGSGGPVLLAEPDAVPEATAAELARLAPARVVVLGGTEALTDEVAEQLAATTDAPVDRLAGATRYETAVAVSADSHPDGADIAFIATGAEYPDALAAGAVAAANGVPLLLAGPEGLDADVLTELARLDPAAVIVIGGEAAVPAAVVNEVEGLGLNVQRLAGADRYETAAQLAATTMPAMSTAFVTTGLDFADALAAGPAAARYGPILLTAETLPPATAAVAGAKNQIVVLGGEAAVGPDVRDALVELLGAD